MWTTIKRGLFKLGTLAKATGLAATLGVIEMVSSSRGRRVLAVLALTGLTVGFVVARPIRSIPAGTAGVRVNRLTGGMTILDEGWALALPGIHEFRTYPLHDQVYRPADAIKSTGAGAYQSVEGLSLGIDITVRWALDPEKMSKAARLRPDELEHDLVQPTVDGALHRAFAQHTVREIFATHRAPIQKGLEDELRTALAGEGVVIKAVAIGGIDLPVQYRTGLEALLSEELSAEKMRYTLELKEKQIKQSELEGEADKVRREKAAAATGAEQIIAAKSQAEAMQHVLPLKEKEIEQKRLEAEAARVVRIKQAEGEAAVERRAVVADVRAVGLLDALQHDAPAPRHLELLGRGGVAGGRARRTGAAREALGEAADRDEERRIDRAFGRDLQVDRRVRDAEGLLARGVAQEVDHRADRRGGGLLEGDRLDVLREHPAPALVAVIPDLEPALLVAADLEPIALPQHGLLRRGVLGGGAQRDVISDDDGGRDGERQHHSSDPPAAGAGGVVVLPPSRPLAKKPLVLGGAMITLILSDSLSARAFWISSGLCLSSAASRAICSVVALPVTSSR